VTVALEICVDDVPGLEAAVEGGADRIELCSALELGGLTPSAALLGRAVATGVPVHVMIRPRGGEFVYSESEIEAMLDDARRAIFLGAAGIVVGVSKADGRLDRDTLARFRDIAGQGAAVLHRAIDMTVDPVEAVGVACGLGFDKILSSGGALAAIEGTTVLKRMVEAAAGRLSIIAGAGINPANVAQVVRETGVREVHASASCAAGTPSTRAMWFGFATGPRKRTDAGIVRSLHAALKETVN